MKKQGIRTPILISITFVVLILLLISTFSIYWIKSKQIEEEVKSLLSEVQCSFNKELGKDIELYNGLLDFIKEDEVLKSAWLAKDRDTLIRHAAPLFEEIRTKYKVTQFYFIDIKKVCFLRVHRLERHGDTIHRFTLAETVREGSPSSGIELGQFSIFALRVVHPWLIGGKLTGYIELGEDIGHITPKLSESLGAELFFVINKSFLNRVNWEEGLRMMGRTGDWDQLSKSVIIDSTLQKMNPVIQKHLRLDHSGHKDLLFKIPLGDKIFKGGFVPLLDASGRAIGDIIVLKDVTKQEASLLNLILLLVVVCVMTGGGLIFFFYVFIGRLEFNLVKTNQDLESEVARHKQTKDFLDNILESSIDCIVVTDNKGFLTRVNKSFLQLLGYDEYQVIGKHIAKLSPVEEGNYESVTGEIVEIGKEFFDDVKDRVNVMFEEGKKVNWESYLLNKNHKLIPVEENIVYLKDEKGEIMGAVGVIRDISERKKEKKKKGL